MIKTFFIALIFFFIIDVFWIYFVATPMYKQEVSSLMELKIPPALLFYVIFLLGLIFFVVNPNQDNTLLNVFFIGAFFHYKFSITQDDLFNSYQSACFVGGALGFLVFGLSLTALSPYFNYHPNFYEFFIAFAIGTSVGGYSFYRKYIAES